MYNFYSECIALSENVASFRVLIKEGCQYIGDANFVYNNRTKNGRFSACFGKDPSDDGWINAMNEHCLEFAKVIFD